MLHIDSHDQPESHRWWHCRATAAVCSQDSQHSSLTHGDCRPMQQTSAKHCRRHPLTSHELKLHSTQTVFWELHTPICHSYNQTFTYKFNCHNIYRWKMLKKINSVVVSPVSTSNCIVFTSSSLAQESSDGSTKNVTSMWVLTEISFSDLALLVSDWNSIRRTNKHIHSAKRFSLETNKRKTPMTNWLTHVQLENGC